jgi:NitT/TauT family transport system permease protein
VTSVVGRHSDEQDEDQASMSASGVGTLDVDGGLGARAARFGRMVVRQWPPILLFIVVLVGWDLTVQAMAEPIRYLPPPSDVFAEIFGRLGWYWHHTQQTLQEAGLGFLIGGTLAGVFALMMTESSIMDRALLPLFVVVKVTPSIVLVPFFVVLLGFGMGPKVILAALTLFYAMLINSVTGFKSVDPGALELLNSVNASRLEIFLRLRFPNSLPHLFSAAKIGVPLAILGAVFAEIYRSQVGLGNVIRTAGEFGAWPRLWGAIYVLAFIGLILIGSLTLLEKRVLRWHVSQKAH